MRAFEPLRAALYDRASSVAVQVLGDSTGNDAHEWVAKVAEMFALEQPAWTVKTRLWSDAAQQYGAAVVVQQRDERCLDGSTGTTTRRLDPAATTHLSGVIDVRIKASLTDWTPGVLRTFVGRNSAVDPNRGWYASLSATGIMQFTYSTAGTGATLATKSSTAAVAFADGATGWLRYVFTPDNGAGSSTVQFYTSTDGATWTQLGTTVTTAGAVTLFNNSTIGFEIGGHSGVMTPELKLFEVEIRDGLDGPLVAPAMPDLWPPYSSAAAEFSGAPVLTFVNGSHAGANIAYLGNAARLKKMCPDYGQLLTFLSDSHNEGITIGAPWITLFEGWRSAVAAQLPAAPVVILTQNPEESGSTWWRQHARRRRDLLGYAHQRGLDIIDVAAVFETAKPTPAMADPVHPNAFGSQIWASLIADQYDKTAP